jgi:hypothetical protein
LTALAEGALGAAALSSVAFVVSRLLGERFGRSLLVVSLFAVVGAYFGFAVVGAPNSAWVVVELAHVFLFGSFALVGWVGSAYWLAAAWALHSVWDVWHIFGPGAVYTPARFASASLGFALMVVAFVLVGNGSGLQGHEPFRTPE